MVGGETEAWGQEVTCLRSHNISVKGKMHGMSVGIKRIMLKILIGTGRQIKQQF